MESKLTLLMLPLGVHLGYNRFFIIGCDYQGGRFYNTKLNIKSSTNYHPELLNKWKEWGEQVGFELYSIVDKKYSKINKYIEYMDFTKALEE